VVIIITSKQCIQCHKTKKVGSYYIHRDNKPGYGIDNICKECARKLSINLEGLKQYCELNSRAFDSDLLTQATDAATKKYENDVEFNSLSEEKRESFLFEKIRNIYFSQQSQTQFYKYVDNGEAPVLIEEDTEKNTPRENEDKKIRSVEWGGMYTRMQLDYLQSYFSDSCSDFKIVTRNHRDYLYKIAKASLAMDEAFNDMLSGNVPGADKRYSAAKMVFDTLSQSAKFSEKTRSANDVAGLSSLSEVVEQLEKTGFLQKKMTFEKDDIDKIGENFRFTIASVGGDF
jgi:hypothetical protein